MHKFRLGQYKGLEITPVPMFTEEELDAAVIESLLTTITQWSKANKPVEKGDEVTISVYATYNGLTVPELCTSDLKYTVGDPKLFTEFTNVIGKQKDDTFEMTIKIPPSSPIERIAGNTVTLSATVLDVSASKQILIDDKLAHQLDPNVTSMLALKAKIRRSIAANGLQVIQENNLQTVLDVIIRNATYELDTDELDKAAQQVATEALQSNIVAKNSKTMDSVLSGREHDEAFYEDCHIVARQETLINLVFRELSSLPEFNLCDEEIETVKARYLDQLLGDTLLFSKIFPTENALREGLRRDKIASYLLQWNLKEYKQPQMQF